MDAVRDWRKKNLESTDDPDHRLAIDALASLLQNESSPSACAKAIAAAYEDWILTLPPSLSSYRTTYGDKTPIFWSVYLRGAIRTFAHDALTRDRLVELVEEISRQPDVRKADGSVPEYCACSDSSLGFWKDLPAFTLCLAENILYYEDPTDFADYEVEEYYAQAPGLLNATAFGAAMLARGRIACALPSEADIILELGIEQPEDRTVRRVREWQVLLPCAATWLILACDQFHQLCFGSQVEDAMEESYTGRRKWAGRAWSPERWALWKEKLLALADSDDIDDECRGFAARAACRLTGTEVKHGMSS